MLTQRDAFFKYLGEQYKKGNYDIIVITCDMGAQSLNEFKDTPFLLNIGACEQLGATLSAGLALKGKRVYLYGITPFIVLRNLEQIRVSICSQNLPVTIVGVGAGLSYDTAGLTHHATEDLNIMRCLPNMTIANISSVEMAEYYAKKSFKYETPLYIRLDKKVDNFYNQISDSSWQILRYGLYKNLIISTGVISHYILDNIKNTDLFEINTFPCNENDLITVLRNIQYDKIISIEEGYKIGGLGDYLLSLGFSVKKVGLSDFCSAKPREEYWKLLLDEVLNELC
jgi:transketolase